MVYDFTARVSDPPWPSLHASVFPLDRNSPDPCSPRNPSRRSDSGWTMSPADTAPRCRCSRPNDVLLAAVERHVQTALLSEAACRDVDITDPSQTDRSLASAEEFPLVESEERPVSVGIVRGWSEGLRIEMS